MPQLDNRVLDNGEKRKIQLKLEVGQFMQFKEKNSRKLEEKENNVQSDDLFLSKAIIETDNRKSVRGAKDKSGKHIQILSDLMTDLEDFNNSNKMYKTLNNDSFSPRKPFENGKSVKQIKDTIVNHNRNGIDKKSSRVTE
jgi:5-methylcytosine-specific restriction endonuclease McrA